RNAHAARGEDDAIGVLSSRVCGLLVERPTTLVAVAELAFVTRKRPAASLHARPGFVRVDVEVHRQDVQRVEEVARLDRAARDRAWLAAHCDLAREPGLELAKSGLPLLLEQLPDRPFGPLDFLVDVVERPSQAQSRLPAHCRLAGAHEADQGDVPPKCP